jgi:hypothetical protein
MLMNDLFHQLGMVFKEITSEIEYLLDSFLIAICDNKHIRHCIETVFSMITAQFSKFIHAVTYQGFILKVEMFIWSFTLKQAFL